jgi:hypothetical protein
MQRSAAVSRYRRDAESKRRTQANGNPVENSARAACRAHFTHHRGMPCTNPPVGIGGIGWSRRANCTRERVV